MQMTVKTRREIEKMRRAGLIVAEILETLEKMVCAGVTTSELDKVAEGIIAKSGGIPAFKGYKLDSGTIAYPACICASINEEVVHGIPSERKLEAGQIISVDVGVELDGYFGDAAATFMVEPVSDEVRKLVRVCKESLELSIKAIKPNCKLNDIARAIQNHAESNGFSVVRQFVGHGIGRNMHEEPQVPNYVTPQSSFRLPEGLCIAIEPMVNAGASEVEVLPDGWTVVTRDRKLSAHFEHTVAITKNGAEVLTKK